MVSSTILIEHGGNTNAIKCQLCGSNASIRAVNMRLPKRTFIDLVEEALSDIIAAFVQDARDVTDDVESRLTPRSCHVNDRTAG